MSFYTYLPLTQESILKKPRHKILCKSKVKGLKVYDIGGSKTEGEIAQREFLYWFQRNLLVLTPAATLQNEQKYLYLFSKRIKYLHLKFTQY